MTLILFAGLVLWLGHMNYSSILCLNFRVKSGLYKVFLCFDLQGETEAL